MGRSRGRRELVARRGRSCAGGRREPLRLVPHVAERGWIVTSAPTRAGAVERTTMISFPRADVERYCHSLGYHCARTSYSGDGPNACVAASWVRRWEPPEGRTSTPTRQRSGGPVGRFRRIDVPETHALTGRGPRPSLVVDRGAEAAPCYSPPMMSARCPRAQSSQAVAKMRHNRRTRGRR